MAIQRKLTAKELALTVCFTALYVVFGFLKISPIIGLPGQAITAAAIAAPLIGVVLGPYIGTLSTFLGGVVGLFIGSFSRLSLVSGIVTALCAGLTCTGKRILSVLVYLSLLIPFAFYPTVGPAWLYPLSLWFQIAALVVLVSPLQSLAAKDLASNNNSRLLYAFFVTSITSTMAGQIAGSLVYEASSWPFLIPDVGLWAINWRVLTFLYPAERTIIALAAALIAAPLVRVLRSANLMSIHPPQSAKAEFGPKAP